MSTLAFQSSVRTYPGSLIPRTSLKSMLEKYIFLYRVKWDETFSARKVYTACILRSQIIIEVDHLIASSRSWEPLSNRRSVVANIECIMNKVTRRILQVIVRTASALPSQGKSLILNVTFLSLYCIATIIMFRTWSGRRFNYSRHVINKKRISEKSRSWWLSLFRSLALPVIYCRFPLSEVTWRSFIYWFAGWTGSTMEDFYYS